MNSISSIVDFNNHPIEDIKYIKNCNSLIKQNSLLVLNEPYPSYRLFVILE